MTEKWERELVELRSVGAPPTVQGRVDEGPHGTAGPGPSRGQRVLAGVVAFAFFGAALALASGAFGDSAVPGISDEPSYPPSPIVFRFLVDDPAGLPSAEMIVDGRLIGGEALSFGWGDTIHDTACCSIATDASIPAGSPILLEGSALHVAAAVHCCDQTMLPPKLYDLDLTADPAVPSEEGRYVLWFSAEWPKGTVNFTWVVEVVGDAKEPEPSLSADPAAEVLLTLTGGEAPDASLTFDGVEAPSQVGSYCWNQPPEDGVVASACVDTVLTPFNTGNLPQMVVGSALSVEGSGDDVRAELGLISGLDPTGPSNDFEESGLFSEPGVWVLSVKTTWAGQPEPVTFYFAIQVVEHWGYPVVVVPDLTGLDHQEASMLLDDLGLEYAWAWREVPGLEHGHVASTDPAAGASLREGDPVLLVIATEITPLSDGPDALDCAEDRYVAFGGPDVRIEPGADAYIRGNLGGIQQQTDVVVQITSTDPDYEWNGVWHVIRDGLVIAVVDWETLDGVACFGTGVAGA